MRQRLIQVEHGPKGSLQMEGASARRHGGIHLLHLSGGPYDRAFQHGTLLRRQIPEGPLPLFNRYLEIFLKQSRARTMAPVILEWLQRRVIPRIEGQFSPRLRASIAGMADGSGVPESEVSAAYAMPEAMLALVARYGRITGKSIALPPIYGCTTAIAGPTKTVRKQLLHARNFDFFGMDRWSAHPVVAFHTPEEGLRHVSVTSAGIVGGGITAMNEKGVVCTVHQHFPRELNFDGLSVGEPAEEVVRLANSVEEAVAVLDQHQTIGTWTYLISDRNGAVAYEMSAMGRRVVPMTDDLLGYANVMMHPDLHTAELEFYTPYVRANHARLVRVQQLLRSREKHDEGGMVEILSDRYDEVSGGNVAFGPTIASVLAAASVVFRPADCRLWVSSGAAPTCYGPYVGFDLKQQGPSGKPKRFNGPLERDDPALRAIRLYAEGAGAALTLDDVAQASALIEQAVELQPESPMYRLVAAMLRVKLNHGEAAQAHVKTALSLTSRPDVTARLQLTLGWALDLQGERREAKAAYAEALALEARDADLRHWARSGRLRAMTARRAAHLPIEFVYGGVA
ncbi:MAG: C45 family autoproteolytic acyltransferase/hydrolase [Bradymonadia bacterium]